MISWAVWRKNDENQLINKKVIGFEILENVVMEVAIFVS